MFNRYPCYFSFPALVLTLILSTVLLLDCKAQSSEKMDWNKFLQGWEEYLDYPSSENADKVSQLLPDSGHVEYTGDEEEEKTLDTIWETLSMLERQVYSGDRSAVNLAFHLYSIADGAFAEELDIILGALIRINAQLFLEGLSNQRAFLKGIESGLPVGNFGVEYVDRFEAQRLEATLRIKALQKIRDPSLVNIRGECIRALKGRLERLEQ